MNRFIFLKLKKLTPNFYFHINNNNSKTRLNCKFEKNK